MRQATGEVCRKVWKLYNASTVFDKWHHECSHLSIETRISRLKRNHSTSSFEFYDFPLFCTPKTNFSAFISRIAQRNFIEFIFQWALDIWSKCFLRPTGAYRLPLVVCSRLPPAEPPIWGICYPRSIQRRKEKRASKALKISGNKKNKAKWVSKKLCCLIK